MKKSQVDLHMERKRALMLMLFFGLVFSLISIFAGVSTRRDFANLSSLLRSDYDYSVLTAEPILRDDYYRLNAGISFTVSADAKKSINADIIMQSEKSAYTKSIDWNAGKLDMYEVAISEGFSKTKGIQIGDIIYSKHIVDGLIHEYIVREILPELTNVRESKQQSYYDGIIIMGYDDKYVDSISHQLMVYTKDSIQQIDSLVSGTPEDILYRTDEILYVIRRLIPYLLLFLILSILVSVILVFVITREIKYNFKRLAMVGFEKRSIDQSHRGLVYRIGFAAALSGFCVSMIISRMFVFCAAEAVFLAFVTFAEMVVAMISAYYFGKRLWR